MEELLLVKSQALACKKKPLFSLKTSEKPFQREQE